MKRVVVMMLGVMALTILMRAEEAFSWNIVSVTNEGEIYLIGENIAGVELHLWFPSEAQITFSPLKKEGWTVGWNQKNNQLIVLIFNIQETFPPMELVLLGRIEGGLPIKGELILASPQGERLQGNLWLEPLPTSVFPCSWGKIKKLFR